MSFDKNDKSALHYFDVCKSEYSQPMSELQSFTEGRQFEYCEAMAREQKLLEVISVLKEACGFYEAKNSWHLGEYDNGTISTTDIEEIIYADYSEFYGGKRARQAIAKVDEMMREIEVEK